MATKKETAGLEIKDISDKEWKEIRDLAVEIQKSGQSGRCLVKATVMSFVEWMIRRDEQIRVPIPDDAPTTKRKNIKGLH